MEIFGFNISNKVIAIIGIVIFVVFAVLFVWGTYNSLVQKDIAVETQKGYVQSAYQRRADLIPNLVETVSGAAKFEKSTQTEIAAMRSQAGQVRSQVYNAQSVEEMQAASNSMGNVLSRLMVVVENYPELKSNQNFLNLQSQLEGTENRVNFERNKYNDAVQDYKNVVRMAPSNVVAGWFGFKEDKWSMFQAKETSQDAPQVKINI